jgi:hypothetical protein
MKFSIRDLLWLTVMVALGVSWWVDNGRIEKAVGKLEGDRRELKADFEEKLTMLDEAQRNLGKARWRVIKTPSRSAEKSPATRFDP